MDRGGGKEGGREGEGGGWVGPGGGGPRTAPPGSGRGRAGAPAPPAGGGPAPARGGWNGPPTRKNSRTTAAAARAPPAYPPPEPLAGVSPATMSFLLQDGNVIVSWTEPGVLQEAENVTGPWNDVAGVGSSHAVAPDSSAMFYRVRH